MASNKKINIPISSLSSEEIYALLDSIDSEDEDDIDNLMNDSDTEFVDRTAAENLEHENVEVVTQEKDDFNGSNHIPTTKPIEAVVRIAKPSAASVDGDDDVLAAKKDNWKWRRRFREQEIKNCSLTEEGIVNITLENPSPLQVFAETIGLEGLLTLIKVESERYAEQNGRVYQTTIDELAAFLGINILMGINRLPAIKDYWSVEEGLGNPLIQKAMTRSRFFEILQNMHFSDNLQNLPPRDSEQYDRAWKLRPLFDHLLKHFQEAMQPESHQSIDEHMCKFKGKSLMWQYMKNKPIKWGFKFWFRCGSKSGYLYEFDMYLGKKGNTEFGLGESVVLSLCKSLKDTNCYVYFDNFFTSPTLMAKLLENGIYGIGTVRANRKHMPTLKQDKQMKRGEHDWQACQSLSATKWMDNKSVILLSNYHDPRSVRDIDRRVKGSKEKVKISCPTVIHEYNQHMGGVDLCDQMKVSYQVDRRSKFRFYLRIFFDFLDIGVVNSKIIYDKMDSTIGMSAMDFCFSLARSLIGKFSNRKRTVPVHRPSKKSKGDSFDTVDHLPEFSATRARCALCSSKKIENRTFIRCMSCNTALCLQKDRNCFYLHHSK